ncbi:MAG: hypothetical protein KAW92_06880 [Candidatus Cloacimonetes bacterium]|nr:hypothetical protein [Candidatus Cloacimonadota bacterium]
MQINIFEDSKWENFLPLTYTRAVFDLRSGIFKLREKIAHYYQKHNCNLIVRKYLEELYKNRFPNRSINQLIKGSNLFINGRLLISSEIAEKINSLTDNSGLFFQQTCIAFKKNIDSDTSISCENISKLMEDISHKEADIKPIDYIWELVDKNSDEIKKDYKIVIINKKNHINKNGNYHLINPEEIFIAKYVDIAPNVVLDADDGPIFLDDHSTIMPNVVIYGPAYIGKNSVIKVGAKIYQGLSIGKFCKVGGEVEQTIFQGYSNKQHDGFLGHSYIGEWVNLGADTNNSNLKNNYKKVKVFFYPEGKYTDTGLQFFGMIIGDHSKTGINTMFNTGCVIGVGCNLYSADLFTGIIPSFSWGSASNLRNYRVNKMIETARIVKKRRGLKLERFEERILENCFQDSIKRRHIFNRK